jgi:hypothetical protein
VPELKHVMVNLVLFHSGPLSGLSTPNDSAMSPDALIACPRTAFGKFTPRNLQQTVVTVEALESTKS